MFNASTLDHSEKQASFHDVTTVLSVHKKSIRAHKAYTDRTTMKVTDIGWFYFAKEEVDTQYKPLEATLLEEMKALHFQDGITLPRTLL